mmetsp:Transcript_50541/g.157806  ORF Transcript_50541/g.157806 Transcript_50541/m.157806 type:complete len:345 (-) Transcript_50541:196-1230(-)
MAAHAPIAAQDLQSFGDESQRSRSDSDILVSEYHAVPLHVRAQAEAWELPREEIQFANVIGEGEGGIVYQCRWRGLDCVAKKLAQDSNASAEYADMINELSTVSRLRHPNLVLFLGACTKGNGPLIILSEYLPGGNLADYAAKQRQLKSRSRGRPSMEIAYTWCMDLARAVCYLHNCTTPVIHRDLKPANLLLTDDLRLKVSDFGLCKTLLKDSADGKPYKMTGNKGTLQYMAPEVIQCLPNYNEKVDIYSAGMIFWFIGMGCEPFEGVGAEVLSQWIASQGKRPPLEEIAMRLGEEFGSLINRCWDGEPELRPSADQVVEELELIWKNEKFGYCQSSFAVSFC